MPSWRGVNHSKSSQLAPRARRPLTWARLAGLLARRARAQRRASPNAALAQQEEAEANKRFARQEPSGADFCGRQPGRWKQFGANLAASCCVALQCVALGCAGLRWVGHKEAGRASGRLRPPHCVCSAHLGFVCLLVCPRPARIIGHNQFQISALGRPNDLGAARARFSENFSRQAGQTRRLPVASRRCCAPTSAALGARKSGRRRRRAAAAAARVKWFCGRWRLVSCTRTPNSAGRGEIESRRQPARQLGSQFAHLQFAHNDNQPAGLFVSRPAPVSRALGRRTFQTFERSNGLRAARENAN